MKSVDDFIIPPLSPTLKTGPVIPPLLIVIKSSVIVIESTNVLSLLPVFNIIV